MKIISKALVFSLLVCLIFTRCTEDSSVEPDDDIISQEQQDAESEQDDNDPLEAVRQVAGAVDCVPKEVILTEIDEDNDTSEFVHVLRYNEQNLLIEYDYTNRELIYYYSYDSIGRIEKVETKLYSSSERSTSLEIQYDQNEIISGKIYSQELDGNLLEVFNNGSGQFLLGDLVLEFNNYLLQKLIVPGYSDWISYSQDKFSNQNTEFILAIFSELDTNYRMLLDSRLQTLSERLLEDGTEYLNVYHDHVLNDDEYITNYKQEWYILENEESTRTIIVDLAYSCE